MASFSLREAAEQAGTSKSTIWRAIKSGRLSATRLDDGGFAIDTSELFRVFQAQRTGERAEGQDAIARETPAKRFATAETASATPALDAETAARLAAAEAELAGLKALLAEVKASRDETRADRDQLRADRDGWRERAERLLAAPASRPWWRRLVG